MSQSFDISNLDLSFGSSIRWIYEKAEVPIS